MTNNSILVLEQHLIMDKVCQPLIDRDKKKQHFFWFFARTELLKCDIDTALNKIKTGWNKLKNILFFLKPWCHFEKLAVLVQQCWLWGWHVVTHVALSYKHIKGCQHAGSKCSVDRWRDAHSKHWSPIINVNKLVFFRRTRCKLHKCICFISITYLSISSVS